MTRLTLVALVLFLSAAQRPPMPPPGNPGHATPAPGAFCAHGPGVPAESACDCEPKCMDNRDEGGQPDGTQYRQEDLAKCRAACHPKACTCGGECGP